MTSQIDKRIDLLHIAAARADQLNDDMDNGEEESVLGHPDTPEVSGEEDECRDEPTHICYENNQWCISQVTGYDDINLCWSSPEDLLQSVQEHGRAWMNALKDLSAKVETTRAQLGKVQKNLTLQSTRTATLEDEVDSLNSDKVRMTKDIDLILSSAEALVTSNESWKKKLTQVEAEKQTLSQEVKLLRLKIQSLSAKDGPSGTHSLTPSTSNEPMDNPRFPDAPLFNGDREKYPGWKIKVIQKLRNSGIQYPTQASQIDYITSRCVEEAEDPVVERADPNGDNPYLLIEEVWDDLDNAFGDSDKIATAEMKLASHEFPMKPSETFDHFLTRFTSTVNKIPYLSTEAKIRVLRDNITKRLQVRITGTRTSNLKDIINEIRRHDIELRRINERRDAFDPKESRKRKDTDTKDNDTPDKRQRTEPNIYRGQENKRRTKELKDKLQETKACWRCGKVGHRSKDANAPCINSPALTNDELKATLDAIPKNK